VIELFDSKTRKVRSSERIKKPKPEVSVDEGDGEDEDEITVKKIKLIVNFLKKKIFIAVLSAFVVKVEITRIVFYFVIFVTRRFTLFAVTRPSPRCPRAIGSAPTANTSDNKNNSSSGCKCGLTMNDNDDCAAVPLSPWTLTRRMWKFVKVVGMTLCFLILMSYSMKGRGSVPRLRPTGRGRTRSMPLV
jgi:hypothetical protein